MEEAGGRKKEKRFFVKCQKEQVARQHSVKHAHHFSNPQKENKRLRQAPCTKTALTSTLLLDHLALLLIVELLLHFLARGGVASDMRLSIVSVIFEPEQVGSIDRFLYEDS